MKMFETLIPFRKSTQWGFADKQGNLQIPCAYDFVYPFGGKLATVQMNNFWGAVNMKGQLIVPCVYQEPLVFREGFAAGKRVKELYEYIDEFGERMTDPIFDFCGPFKNGKAIVSHRSRHGVINSEFESVIKLFMNK